MIESRSPHASPAANSSAYPALAGWIVPVATPFDERGAVDERAFEEHIDYLAARGARRLWINGTTGEFFSLTQGERIRTLELARRRFAGPVIFQAGACNLGETRELARRAVDIGADAISSVPPFYIAGAPADGIVAWFNELAESISVPFLVYNFPKHTGNSVDAAMLTAIRHDGMKDSSGDLSLIGATPRFFVGGDKKVLATYAGGGVGFVSAISNAFPETYAAIERAIEKGDGDEAQRLQAILLELVDAIAGNHGMARIKWILSHRLPRYPRRVRPPLVPVAREDEPEMGRLAAEHA